jgi:hypothetical protein
MGVELELHVEHGRIVRKVRGSAKPLNDEIKESSVYLRYVHNITQNQAQFQRSFFRIGSIVFLAGIVISI